MTVGVQFAHAPMAKGSKFSIRVRDVTHLEGVLLGATKVINLPQGP